MENREILKIKNKRKIKPSIFFQLNENINQEERIRVTKKLLKEKTIKNDFENSIANVNMEDLHEILENYKYYKDDDSLFKLNLNNTYILNNKIAFLDDIKKKLLKYLQERSKELSITNEDSCDSTKKENGFSR